MWMKNLQGRKVGVGGTSTTQNTAALETTPTRVICSHKLNVTWSSKNDLFLKVTYNSANQMAGSPIMYNRRIMPILKLNKI